MTVKQGDSGESIATPLKTAGVVKTAHGIPRRLRGGPGASAKIQAGTYTLKKGMKAIDAFTMLTDPANRGVPAPTIPEGLWASEVFPRLSKATGVPVADYEAGSQGPGRPGSARRGRQGRGLPLPVELRVRQERPRGRRSSSRWSHMTLAELDARPASSRRTTTAILTLASHHRGRGQAATTTAPRSPGSSRTGSTTQTARPSADSRWTPPCPTARKRGRAGTSNGPQLGQPLQHLQGHRVCRRDRSTTRGGLDRGRGQAGRGSVVLLRRGQPDRRARPSSR